MTDDPKTAIALEEQLVQLEQYTNDLQHVDLAHDAPRIRAGGLIQLPKDRAVNPGYKALRGFASAYTTCLCLLESALERALNARDPNRLPIESVLDPQKMEVELSARAQTPIKPEKMTIHAVTLNDAIRAGLITIDEGHVLGARKPWDEADCDLGVATTVLRDDVKLLRDITARLKAGIG